MDYYPDTERETLTDRLEVVIRGLDALSALYTATRHPSLPPDTHGFDCSPRAKYWRVWAQGWRRNPYGDDPDDLIEGQRSVEFFVDRATGDVYKGSWKRPESFVPRFNIMTAEGRARLFAHKYRNPYGYLYLDVIAKVEKELDL